jgi:hypothetical protein
MAEEVSYVANPCAAMAHPCEYPPSRPGAVHCNTAMWNAELPATPYAATRDRTADKKSVGLTLPPVVRISFSSTSQSGIRSPRT